MNTNGRQTAPPLEEVVLVTFLVCVRLLEASSCVYALLGFLRSPGAWLFGCWRFLAEVSQRFVGEFVDTASAFLPRSAPMVGSS